MAHTKREKRITCAKFRDNRSIIEPYATISVKADQYICIEAASQSDLIGTKRCSTLVQETQFCQISSCSDPNCGMSLANNKYVEVEAGGRTDKATSTQLLILNRSVHFSWVQYRFFWQVGTSSDGPILLYPDHMWYRVYKIQQICMKMTDINHTPSK